MANKRDIEFNSFHFVGGHPHARELFKSSVTKVELEVSSYCNRVCSFCPNSIFDRRSAKTHIDPKLYASILEDLAAIDYRGDVVFARYSEPLAEREYFLERLNQLRATTPTATPRVYSNGDYLTPEYLDALYGAGLREMMVSSYLGEQQPYTEEAMRARLFERIADLGFPHQVIEDRPGYVLARIEYRPDMNLFYRGKNYEDPVELSGVPQTLDRGGSVAVRKQFHRRSPCFAVFTELAVEIDGSVVPCCNIRTDNPEHVAYRIGKVGTDGDIFTIWSSAAAAGWRRELFGFGDKKAPCATCTYKVMIETPAGAAKFRAAAAQLGLPPD